MCSTPVHVFHHSMCVTATPMLQSPLLPLLVRPRRPKLRHQPQPPCSPQGTQGSGMHGRVRTPGGCLSVVCVGGGDSEAGAGYLGTGG